MSKTNPKPTNVTIQQFDECYGFIRRAWVSVGQSGTLAQVKLVYYRTTTQAEVKVMFDSLGCKSVKARLTAQALEKAADIAAEWEQEAKRIQQDCERRQGSLFNNERELIAA